MGVIRTNAAAAMLGVSPNTLRSWERRFGFPEPRRTAGGHRQFDLGRDRGAARGLRGDAQRLLRDRRRPRARRRPGVRRRACVRRFNRFDESEADRILEESLAVRSVERTVEEVLLPAVEALAECDRHRPRVRLRLALGASWLAAAMRVAPAADARRGRR